MMELGKEVEIPKHKWNSLDGQKVQTTFTFPPLKSTLLEEEEK
jgi:hypothetical protein